MSTTYAQLGESATISYERILDDVCALYQTENKLLRDLAIDIMRVLEYDKEFKVALERHVEENPFQQEETIHVYAKVSQVRHGHWIEGPMCIECSCCGETFSDEIVYMCDPYRKPKRCPECGAHMDEEVNDGQDDRDR